MRHPEKPPVYGVMAEFDTPTQLVNAAREVRGRGYWKVEAYSPFPIEELNHALRLPRNKLPLIVLAAGILGGALGYLLQYWSTVWHYPLNIAGRPLHSWPMYIVITFEVTVLFASCAAFFGALALCGFPAPYHPVFNVERFALASRNRFFLVVEAVDPMFDRERTAEFLRGLDAREVTEVAH